MRRKAIDRGLLILVLLLAGSRSYAGVPDWLRSLAQQPAKHYPDDANAVVLLDDRQTSVKDNGEIVTRVRVAYRILRPEGKTFASFGLYFDSDTKVSYLKAWSITAQGQEYESKEPLERNENSFEVYSDEKEKFIGVPGDAVGSVVGYEYEQKQRPYIFQDEWDFQQSIPVEHARYQLHLGKTWESRIDWVNHDEIKSTSQNGDQVWEVSDVPRIEREFSRPSIGALAGRAIVSFFSSQAQAQTYKDWNEFGLWYLRLAAGTNDPSQPLRHNVDEIAPSSLPVLERIRALARFAQHDVRYVEIKIGIGGLRPHPAGDTFAHKYGDCKDKATVLSSMLSVIGVKSFPVLVHTERGVFTRSSPPFAGFDHMILAVQLPQASVPDAFPALYEDARFGRLLIFDPTNEFVPFGQIPYYEQDSYAALITENGGELIHLPVSKPELNGVRRAAHLKLLSDGTLAGQVDEVRTGWSAMVLREELKDESEQNRKKVIEHYLREMMGNFQVDDFSFENLADIDKDLVVHYKFTSAHYAKNAGGLLLLRPRVVGEYAGAYDPTKPRRYPYQIDAPFLNTDTVEIALPDGFAVDELPDPAKINAPFAEYTSKTESAGNVVKYTRQYKVETTLVPVDQVPQLRSLFGRINADEKNMAVLKKAN